ncbi:MAG: hypothetical protein JWP81_2854 [Ferruginibacter sp.]|nr:hypothetical protein [Ferruginibacter sp.]
MGKHDDEIADLLSREEVGYLFSFKGSDAPYLQKGNEALQLVAEKYRDHPLAVYAQFVKGVNEQRTFKTITPEKKLVVREPNFAQGEALLNEVIEKSKAGKGLDNISLNQSMETLAKAYQREGNMEAATGTVEGIVTHFNKQPIKPEVKAMIARKAATVLEPEKDEKRNNGMAQ